MKQPPKFVAQGKSATMVCQLHKSLYAIKQSLWAWFHKFSTAVQQFGMLYWRWPFFFIITCLKGVFILLFI